MPHAQRTLETAVAEEVVEPASIVEVEPERRPGGVAATIKVAAAPLVTCQK
jgi:hypothetical protein